MTPQQNPEPLRGRQSERTGREDERYAARLTEKRRALIKRVFLITICGLLVIALFVGWHERGRRTSLVPRNIQKSVDFTVYYPANLPSGYTLDTQSFRLAESGVVLFAVTDSSGKDIAFSEQQQPSAAEMDKFISSYVPLNSSLQLPLGQAKIGAYGSAPDIRTVASLPIQSGPWLIVTAPSEVSHDDLVAILRSLAK